MADQGLRGIPELRDDALAFLEHSPPSAWRNVLGEAIGAQTPLAELSRAGNVGETPQLAATGAHRTAGMGQSHEETPSNSNLLAALHSGLEQAHEVQGALDGVVGIGARRRGQRATSRSFGINGDQRRGAYIFTASIVVLIVVAFLVKWWLA